MQEFLSRYLGVLFLREVFSTFLPSTKACWTHKFLHLGVDQQYRNSFLIGQNAGGKTLILQVYNPPVSDPLFDSSPAQRLQINQSMHSMIKFFVLDALPR